MSIRNLNNDHFSDAEKSQVSAAWATIMNVLNIHAVALSPEDRQKYGSIAEQNKLVVNKSLEYHQVQPHLDSPDVDYQELAADWADRNFLAGLVSSMTEASLICNNLRITHDYDAYKSSSDDYQHAKYRMNRPNGAGWESKYNDLKPFFTTNIGGTKHEDDDEDTTAAS